MNKKILKTLASLKHLIEKDVEYGGFTDSKTCSYEFKKGEVGEIRFNYHMSEFREKVNRGKRVFHTHQEHRNPEPSGEDVIVTAISGAESYIITSLGIYELTPTKYIDITEIKVKNVRVIGGIDYIDDDVEYDDTYFEEISKELGVKTKLYRYDEIEKYK